jgi:hypothetical protein
MPAVYRFTAWDTDICQVLSPHYGTLDAIAGVRGAILKPDQFITVDVGQLSGHGFYPKANEWRVEVIDRVLAKLGNTPDVQLQEGFFAMVRRRRPNETYVLSQADTGPEYEMERTAVENYLQGKMRLDAGIWPPKE